MLQIFSFGSGSSGNCLLVSNERDAVLIDAGVGIRMVRRVAQQYALPMGRLRALLITHDHADHIWSAANVVRQYNLPAYATEKVHHVMTRGLRTMHPLPIECRRMVAPDETFPIASFTITPFTLPHDATENVGYAIESEGHRLAVMTDVGHVSENVAKYIQWADSLVVEANYDPEMLANGSYPVMLQRRIADGNGHLSNPQAAEALAAYFHPSLRTVCLCHLSEHNNMPELAHDTIAQALAQRGVVEKRDYQLHVLKRRTPTGPITLTQPDKDDNE